VQRARDVPLPACDDGPLPSTCLTSFPNRGFWSFRFCYPQYSRDNRLQMAYLGKGGVNLR
jgi:hypothetical protein